MLSLFNIGGRFFWASISDHLGRKRTYYLFFLLGIALYALAPTAAHIGSKALFVLMFGVILSMYGGGFATVPAYLADIFGTQFVGAIHGRLLTAWSTAGIIGPVIVNYIREYEKSIGVPSDKLYDVTMYVLAGLLVLGLIANSLVRPLAERWYMRPDEVLALQPRATVAVHPRRLVRDRPRRVRWQGTGCLAARRRADLVGRVGHPLEGQRAVPVSGVSAAGYRHRRRRVRQCAAAGVASLASGTITAPRPRPINPARRRRHQPGRSRADGAQRVADRLRHLLDAVGDRRPAILLQPVQHDPAADPEHGGGADQAQELEEGRHHADDAAADGAGHGLAAAGQRHADIVGLHDHRHGAIDQNRDADADHGQHEHPGPERAAGDRAQRDRHDLGREDEIGADGATHAPILLALGTLDGRGRRDGVGRRRMRPDQLDHLLGTLVAEIGATQHQERRDAPRRQLTQRQGGRRQDQQLVAQRAQGDLADDRQLALGHEAHDVAGHHGRIVDHDPDGLDAGPRRLCGGIVERARGELGEADHVVDQGGQTDAHAGSRHGLIDGVAGGCRHSAARSRADLPT